MLKRLRLAAALFLVAAVVLINAGTTHSKVPSVKAEKPQKSGAGYRWTTAFDMSHAEIFSPVKDGPLNYSDFAARLTKSGEKVELNSGKVTAKTLSTVRTYIIAGPSKPLSPDETAALKAFVEAGGNLLVLLHISSPVARLTEEFGIIVSNFVLAEAENTIDSQAQDFHVTRFKLHPVTRGLKKVSFYGTWGLMAMDKASVVAETSPKSWADANRNRAYDKGEPVQAFGVIAVGAPGKGKVVVVADDAPFANKFFGEADNRKLADNIMRWFKG